MAASPPYVKEGPPTEITFDEDGSYLDLNLYDVFADDDPEDTELDLANFEVEGLDVSIDQTTGLVNISGEENFHGQVELVFRAMDGRGYFADHELNVTVLSVNDRPEAVGKINRRSWWEGDDYFINVSQYFTDADGDQLFYYAVIEPDYYTCVNTDGDPRNPGFDLICQDPNFYGYLQVVFTAYDKDPAIHGDEALSAKMTAIFEVIGYNNPPEIVKYEPISSAVEIMEMEVATFKVLGILDIDSSSFRFKWFVDGREAEGHTSTEFSYPQDPSFHTAGVYEISIQIRDNLGEPTITPLVWTLTIINVNRGPTVTLWDRELRVPYTEQIELRATGLDVDGDELTYRWYLFREDKEKKDIGQGKELDYKKDLPPGRHYFMCEVSDGDLTETTDWMLVTVEEVETPGPTGTLATMALLIATLFLTIASRRRGGHSKAY